MTGFEPMNRGYWYYQLSTYLAWLGYTPAMTPTGLEPALQPWKGCVLAFWLWRLSRRSGTRTHKASGNGFTVRCDSPSSPFPYIYTNKKRINVCHINPSSKIIVTSGSEFGCSKTNITFIIKVTSKAFIITIILHSDCFHFCVILSYFFNSIFIIAYTALKVNDLSWFYQSLFSL